ncbi:hypothetical protein TrVGV298_011376 [Trichoderma virens]|nr:hypothetical protein TrVGV298_011376 [Trichoderma virens]
MLLEIQLGRELEFFNDPKNYYDEDPNIAQHLLALDLVKDKKLWPPENAWMVIKEIIEICIDDNKTKAMFKNDNLMVRQRIYEQIVAPFRVFVLNAWKSDGIEVVDPVTSEKAAFSEKGMIQAMEGLSNLKMNEQSLTLLPPPVITHGFELEYSENWLQNLDDFTEKLSIIGTRDEKKCPRVKIAILDTGIAEDYYHDFNEYIEEYKDFVSSKNELRQDGTGHGSTTLRLLLRLTSDVKVFIGRVFEHNHADEETERLMAEAITYAKMEWKVDIICIPSGFNADLRSPPYRQQLYTAMTSDTRTLIFAAASNLGFASEITFPGCLSKSSKVLCCFSTAGDGDPDRPGFNPAAVPNTYNFALLGEGIQIDATDQPIRGTSYSTIIAGVIAAYILDFANHPDTKDKIKDAWYLREVEGMTAIFASMSNVKKNGYDIIEPWRLGRHHRPEGLSKKELRQEICRNISTALGGRNSRGY